VRAVIQRVSSASVLVKDHPIANIKIGLLILLGVEQEDTRNDVCWLAKKISRLRIFSDENGLMNRAVDEVGGEIIVVSQFTLLASTKKGNRPSFIKAARPEIAIPLYNLFCKQMSDYCGKKVKTGEFGAMMDIQLTNMGPVTIIIDSKVKE
jgi:D-tyrosyl-tRNA(Tyr) deacylase